MSALYLSEPDIEAIEFIFFDRHKYADSSDRDRHAEEVADVLERWQKALRIQFWFALNVGGLYQAALLFESQTWDLAVMEILKANYDVYYSDESIKTYKPQPRSEQHP